MSSTDHRGIPPGNAAIIAAVIGAAALILGAIIGVVFGAKSQPIQVFLGGDTPTTVSQSNILGLPLPQPTCTLLPTYTPYPTFTPNIRVVTQAPLIVTATAGADQQNPPPGSIIPAGEGYAKNGITVTADKSLVVGGQNFGFNLSIQNESGQDQVVLWNHSFLHVRDDRGKICRQEHEGESLWKLDRQFSVSNRSTFRIHSSLLDGHCVFCPDTDYDRETEPFIGPIDARAKFIILTIDQLKGMTNLNWRYDIQ